MPLDPGVRGARLRLLLILAAALTIAAFTAAGVSLLQASHDRNFTLQQITLEQTAQNSTLRSILCDSQSATLKSERSPRVQAVVIKFYRRETDRLHTKPCP